MIQAEIGLVRIIVLIESEKYGYNRHSSDKNKYIRRLRYVLRGKGIVKNAEPPQ